MFDFSWDIFVSQEKLQTMVMQKLWGVIEVYYGIVQVVNEMKLIYEMGEFCFERPKTY